MLGPAAAREDTTIKRIKQTLVSIESVLADAEAERSPLGPRAWTMERHSESLRRELRAARSTDEPPSVVTVLELIDIETRRRAAVARMAQLDALIAALRDKRSLVIDDLETIVVQRASTRSMERAVASWSDTGRLITYSADWEAVALCESSGRWDIDARFDGGLQFDPPTWIGFGGAEFARYAFQATKRQQITVAERVLAIQGPKAWPNCFQPLSIL